jgi:homoserine O-acetyltransferase
MNHPPLQPDWIDRPHHSLALGDFLLESGECIKDASVSYVIHGTLNEARTNAVLGLSAIGSNHHRLDFLIGDNQALDPAQWAVICVDALGNGLSSSPSNSTRQPGLTFPRFSIRDMVASQKCLMRHLDITQWHAVVGTSMGGMQALQWAVSFPSAMRRVVAMTPIARTTSWSAAINAAARAALMADARWAEAGHHSTGIPAWIALMQLISGRTPASLERDFADPASLGQWLQQRLSWQLAQNTHPVDWVYQSYAYDAHDVGTTAAFAGNTEAALRSITAATLVMAPPLDLYNPAASARWAADRIPGATFVEIPSVRGHQSASAAVPENGVFLNRHVGEFLAASPIA